MVATDPQEALVEVTAAQKAIKGVLQFLPERSQRGLVLGGINLKEIV